MTEETTTPATAEEEAPQEEEAPAEQPTPEEEPQQEEQPQDPLAEAEAKRDEYLELAQRTQADFENYRKRMARENAAAIDRGVGKLARNCCPRSTTSTMR